MKLGTYSSYLNQSIFAVFWKKKKIKNMRL